MNKSTQRQHINRLDQLVRPGMDGNSNLAWKDLWQVVDVLAGYGAPRYMFLNLPNKTNIVQVARLHDELIVDHRHLV